jgi:hypothetical protein
MPDKQTYREPNQLACGREGERKINGDQLTCAQEGEGRPMPNQLTYGREGGKTNVMVADLWQRRRWTNGEPADLWQGRRKENQWRTS